MATKRIFIAIDLTENTRDEAARYISELRADRGGCRISWVKPGNLHLTLRFLGDTEESLLADLFRAVRLASGSVPNFMLTLEGTGSFPDARRPRVLWLGVGGDLHKAAALRESLDGELSSLRIGADDKRFKPHLTIARIKDPRSCEDLTISHISKTFGPMPVPVGEIVIYESRLGKAGSTYTRLASCPLGRK